MNKHNGFEIITGTCINGNIWYGIARHPAYQTIITNHFDTEDDAINMLIELIDKQLGLIK